MAYVIVPQRPWLASRPCAVYWPVHPADAFGVHWYGRFLAHVEHGCGYVGEQCDSPKKGIEDPARCQLL